MLTAGGFLLLSLDHIPFLGSPGADLNTAFGALGFNCSVGCVYVSQKYPDTVWRSSCVFFREAWFDLLQNGYDGPPNSIALGGCLFRTGDVAGILESPMLDAVSAHYDLTRRFSDSQFPAVDEFHIVQLNSYHFGIPASIIGRSWPPDDLSHRSSDHPNTAFSVDGIDVLGDDSPAASMTIQDSLDLSVIRSLPKPQFVSQYGLTKMRKVVRVSVQSLTQTQKVLKLSGVHHTVRDDLIVAVTPWLRCAVAFCASENSF